MSNTKPSINQILANPELLNHDGCFSFYDWFCKESSLESRAKKFLPKLKFLVNEGLIDGDKNYVWFKNNCPMSGSLYDDMRISTIDNDDFLGGLCASSGHNSIKGQAEMWLLDRKDSNQDIEYVQADSWGELKKMLKLDKSVRSKVSGHFNSRNPQ